MRKLLFVTAALWASSLLALEPYQGQDYEVRSWHCGAPLIEALRQSDPDGLLDDQAGKLMLKESLEEVSKSNLRYIRKQLGALSADEKKIIDIIETKYAPAIVHRTTLEYSKIILKNNGIISATKRNASTRFTPNIEQSLFSGRDCIFTSVAPPYGIQDYGTTIFRFRDNQGFAWGSILTGLTWTKEVAGKSLSEPATHEMKIKFARQIFTNNHWNEALALQIISHARKGTSIRGKGDPYDKTKILQELININSESGFWKKVVKHRLAYLEGHYTDNVQNDNFLFVQFRTMDMNEVRAWGFPSTWFEGNPYSFIQSFNRSI